VPVFRSSPGLLIASNPLPCDIVCAEADTVVSRLNQEKDRAWLLSISTLR
jgi:hypothetical protein